MKKAEIPKRDMKKFLEEMREFFSVSVERINDGESPGKIIQELYKELEHEALEHFRLF